MLCIFATVFIQDNIILPSEKSCWSVCFSQLYKLSVKVLVYGLLASHLSVMRLMGKQWKTDSCLVRTMSTDKYCTRYFNTCRIMCLLKPCVFFVFHEDSPGWDSGRSNGFVNGYHDNRTNGGFGGRGPPRNDRGGRGAYRGNRGGGSFNQPLQNAGGEILTCLRMFNYKPSFGQMTV